MEDRATVTDAERVAWIACVLLILGDFVSAQTHLRQRDFLNLGSSEGYLNYGRTEYEPYPELISARNRYDRLGNFQRGDTGPSLGNYSDRV